ncbi:MAG: Tetrahydromethanopterin S-methyltransferase subunit H [Candidatus Bathyarchaeota archaeon BA1]|nr:MAG: Tetrahydromethanopterin S-methyltransferase subunit H [Candidatus Bathyarchaeota archaeon BA1]
MLKFENEQRTLHIGSVDVGGQPGELPTCLIGTIFYEGHKIVKDAESGAFGREKAEGLIVKQEELSERTGNPHMVDVIGLTSKAILRYIDFVAGVTDAPILVDSPFADVSISGVKYAAETGLLDRIIYNSITYHIKDEEIKALRDVGIKSAVILAYNPRNVWPRGRIELLQGCSSERGLLKIAEEAGIKNILVDTAVLDVPSIGLAAEAVYLVKKQLALPSGASPSNAVLEWRRAKELGVHAKNVCVASAIVAMQHAGADFILYGPIGKADVVFPAVAMTDAVIAYAARLHGVAPKTEKHPLYKIF